MPNTLPRSKSPDGISYHRSGHGAPLVFLHGVGLRAESWQSQIDDLQSDFELFALDLPGHGSSSQLKNDMPELAEYTKCIANFITTTIGDQVVIAGHSMGAMIALDLAARYSALCTGVAALNAIYRRTPEAHQAVRQRAASLIEDQARKDTKQNFAEAPVTRWFGESPVGDEARSSELCRQWLMEVDREGYSKAYSIFANENGPSDEALSNISVPVLFLTGENDQNSTPAMSKAMAEAVDRSSSVIVAGAGHMALMTHGQEVNTSLRDFLSQNQYPAPSQNSGNSKSMRENYP